MELIILAAVIIGIYLLGKYALEEGVRLEQQKKLQKNIREWEKKNIQDKRKEIIWERNPDTGKVRSRSIGDYDNTNDEDIWEGSYPDKEMEE